jgi:hypothetical protein
VQRIIKADFGGFFVVVFEVLSKNVGYEKAVGIFGEYVRIRRHKSGNCDKKFKSVEEILN